MNVDKLLSPEWAVTAENKDKNITCNETKDANKLKRGQLCENA